MKNHMLSNMKTCCSYLDIDDKILHIKTLISITKQKDIGVEIKFSDVNLREHTILVTKVEGQNVMSLDNTNIREMLEPKTRIIQMGDIEFYENDNIVVNKGLWGDITGTRQYSTSPEIGYDSLQVDWIRSSLKYSLEALEKQTHALEALVQQRDRMLDLSL